MPSCPRCGAEVGPQDRFCKSCGNTLTANTTQASGDPASQPQGGQQNPPPSPTATLYCQECGALNPAGVTYCQSCGSADLKPTPPPRIKRPTGVTVLGILAILVSIILIIAGSFVAIAFAAIGLGFLSPLFLAIGILELIFAIAFLTGRNWGRILMMVGAVLFLPAVPVGTILGIILLWYLTRPRVAAYFKQPKK